MCSVLLTFKIWCGAASQSRERGRCILGSRRGWLGCRRIFGSEWRARRGLETAIKIGFAAQSLAERPIRETKGDQRHAPADQQEQLPGPGAVYGSKLWGHEPQEQHRCERCGT